MQACLPGQWGLPNSPEASRSGKSARPFWKSMLIVKSLHFQKRLGSYFYRMFWLLKVRRCISASSATRDFCKCIRKYQIRCRYSSCWAKLAVSTPWVPEDNCCCACHFWPRSALRQMQSGQYRTPKQARFILSSSKQFTHFWPIGAHNSQRHRPKHRGALEGSTAPVSKMKIFLWSQDCLRSCNLPLISRLSQVLH